MEKLTDSFLSTVEYVPHNKRHTIEQRHILRFLSDVKAIMQMFVHIKLYNGMASLMAALSLYRIYIDIAGEHVHALIDTGAARTLMSEN